MNSNLVLFLRTTHTQRSEREREREREKERENNTYSNLLASLEVFLTQLVAQGNGLYAVWPRVALAFLMR